MDSKSETRRRMRELKRQVTPDEKLRRSAAVMERLKQTPQFAAAHTVLLYWSMADEVQTHDFVDAICSQKTVLLPCVDGDDLRLRRYTGRDCLVKGEQFGIEEPRGPEWTDLDAIDAIVVPGVAFDRHRNRMGRGRGFYDRLLQSTPKAWKAGVAYDFQVLDEIPVEEHDVKMDTVIGESFTV